MKKLIIITFGLLLLTFPPGLNAQEKAQRSLFPVCNERKCGYIDSTGKMIINLQFDNAFEFSEDFARVTIGNKIGFIDKRGKLVIAPQFSWALDFAEGLAPVEIEVLDGHLRKWGYIDQSGKMVIAQQFEEAMRFSDGLAYSGPRN